MVNLKFMVANRSFAPAARDLKQPSDYVTGKGPDDWSNKIKRSMERQKKL